MYWKNNKRNIILKTAINILFLYFNAVLMKYRLLHICLVLIVLGLWSSCTKKEYECFTVDTYSRVPGVAFVGFDIETLDTIYKYHYILSEEDVVELKSVDTMIYTDTNMYYIGDTVFIKSPYNEYGPFFYPEYGVKDSISIPGANYSFVITGVEGELVYNPYTSSTPCNNRFQYAFYIEGIEVDEQPASIVYKYAGTLNAYMFISKK